MKYLKKYGLSLLETIISLLITLFLLTLLYYFNLINQNTYKILKTIIIIITILINGFFLGKKSLNKGYLEGIKLGLLLTIIFIIPTLITNNFNIKCLLYYLILIITTTLGSMIGITQKKEIT